MIILGAGMAGLLAAHYFREQKPVIWEQQESLPHNHSALLRLRSDAIGRITGVPLRQVQVQKAVLESSGELVTTTHLRHANEYSYKVLGKVLPRSVLDLAPATRWVPENPDTFIADMAQGLNIQFGKVAKPLPLHADEVGSVPEFGISTLPLSFWWQALEMPAVEFDARPIWVITADLQPYMIDVYQTIYVPGTPQDLEDVYRISVSGHKLIIELSGDPANGTTQIITASLNAIFGAPLYANNIVLRMMKLGKIAPIDTTIRKRAIIQLSDRFNIASFGRFATWRQLLLDDLVHDLEVIRKLQNNPYAARLHRL